MENYNMPQQQAQQQMPAQQQAQQNDSMKALTAMMLTEENLKRYGEILGLRAHNFILSMLDFINADEKLKRCDQAELITAMQKIAILDLLPSKEFGMVNLLPFWSNKEGKYHATLVIGYKGLVNIAIRGGGVKYLNWGKVYDGGHLKRRNWLTGEIEFNDSFIPTPQNRVIGYYAYYERMDGYKATLFSTVEEIAEHAVLYGNFGKAMPTKAQLMEKAGKRGQGLGWLADFDKMAEKTVVRSLLKARAVMTDALAIAIEASEKEDNETMAVEAVEERNNANRQMTCMPPIEEAKVVTQETAQPQNGQNLAGNGANSQPNPQAAPITQPTQQNAPQPQFAQQPVQQAMQFQQPQQQFAQRRW